MPYHDDTNLSTESVLETLLNRKDFWHLCAKAATDAREQDLVIIDPGDAIDFDEEQLDRLWEKYNAYTKPFRRKADWITLQYFGMTNQDLYNGFQARLMSQYSRFAVVSDGSIGYSGDEIKAYYESADELEYHHPSEEIQPLDQMLDAVDGDINLKMKEAEEYYKQTGYVMIIPTMIPNLEALERAWDAYNQMIWRHQRMADWKTVELFGLTNQQLYMAMRDMYMNSEPDESEFDITIDKNYMTPGRLIENYLFSNLTEFTCNELYGTLMKINENADGITTRVAGDRIIDKAIDQFDGLSVNVPSAVFSYTDLPMWTPDEMIDMGVVPYGNPEDGSEGPGTDIVPSIKWDSKEWFTEYNNGWNLGGVFSDKFNEYNTARIHRLEALYIDPQLENADWRMEVIKCGWRPEIPFSPRNRSLVDESQNARLNDGSTTNIYDVSDTPVIKEGIEINLKDNAALKPLYIVMVSGQATFSKLIKKVTDSKYSHCTLSLDPSLKRCYSYGTDPAVSLRGGFIIEDIAGRAKDTFVRVYTVFVSNEVFETIKNNVEWFIAHQKETFYSWANLITYLFKTPMERNNAMICSQFVDRMLKLGKIDFTKAKSSLISPKDMDNYASRSKSVYTVYKGEVGRYKPTVIENRVKSLMSHARKFVGGSNSVKINAVESSLLLDKDFASTFYESSQGLLTERQNRLFNSLIRPYLEIKEIPIKIDNKGDIFITNLMRGSYEAEYSKSHKLLKEYEKENNTEGMKEELCKLWMLLNMIEKELYGTKTKTPEKRKDLYTARAHIMQDFKKYLAIVQKNEKDFNFARFFDESPYSNNQYKISGSTIRGVITIAKQIL